jgi:hypothetical protein
VLPIPTTEEFLGVELHVQSPPFSGVDTDPSTVWNFQGASGIAFIDTEVTRTHRKTGEQQVLRSLMNHMTFMQGIYVGRDGHVRDGTFSLVWIDIYAPGGDPQLHDFNPRITQNGLFWTVVLPADTVDVDLDAGTATLEVHDLHMKDYFTAENAILGNMGPPTPAVVSFQVVWTATGGVNVFNNTAQQFRGEFRNAEAHMEYSGRAGEFRFQSAPLGASTTAAAELGQESNGSFY